MAFASFGTESQARRKKVYYEGTDTIYEGMPVAYNYDTTTNILGWDPEDEEKSSTTAEGYQNEGKFLRVELCTAVNAFAFAGVVAGASYAGLDGPRWIDIFVPNGAIVPVRTDKSITIKDRLYLEASANTVVNDAAALPCIGVAMETVDRSSAAGIVLAKLEPVVASNNVDEVTAHSRTAVQLPTAAIWQNFDLDTLRRNPFAGALLEADYKRPADFAFNSFIDATYAASAGGKTPTEHVRPGVDASGALVLFTTTDNQAAELQYQCPITTTGAGKWAFECRVKVSEITNAQNNFFGLAIPQSLVGNLIGDTGAIADGGAIGFQKKEGDPDVIDFVYDKASQSQNEHDDDYVTLVADTYITLGMYYDGATIQGYLNGVASGTAISAVDIAAADFPAATVMLPALAVKAGHADDYTTSVDWIRVAQLA
jgi:hypothetical protein